MYQPVNESQKIVHIRSQDLPASAFVNPNLTTDFYIDLNNPFEAYQGESILIALHSASIPMTMYNVDATANRVAFYENNILISNLTIPIGNYTLKSLGTTVASLMTTASTSGTVYTATYGSLRNTISFSSGSGSSITTFALGFAVADSAYTQLGFENGSTNTSSVAIAGVASLTSANACSLIKYFSVYILCDAILGTSLNTFGNTSQVLERIGLANANSLLYYRPTTTVQRFMIKDKILRRMRITLLFDEDSPVDLNGQHIELSLQISIVRTPDRTVPDSSKPEYQDVETA
jgi:hypothetical protein